MFTQDAERQVKDFCENLPSLKQTLLAMWTRSHLEHNRMLYKASVLEARDDAHERDEGWNQT